MRFHGHKARLIVDLETYSTVDLKKTGAHAYAEHPSTGVHCVAWHIKGGVDATDTVQLWRPGDDPPVRLFEHVLNGGRVVAHNYLFEFNVWAELLHRRFGWPVPDLEAMSCTMARALYFGLPASLDELGEALSLTATKDKAARANMLRLARPRAPAPAVTWWHEDPEEGPPRLAQLYAYCKRDVEAESEADDKLPELPDHERRVFLMDGRINQRGVALDHGLIAKLEAVTDGELDNLNDTMARVTSGHVISFNQVAKLTVWLAGQSVTVSSLDRDGVLAGLAQTAPGTLAQHALLIRQEGARASTAKLTAMDAARSRDGRARGMFQYYGASRTGRWAGRRAQFQNFPRGSLKPTVLEQAIAWVMRGRTADELRPFFPGTVMGLVASALRGCLCAARGDVLVSVDLAQIEARVVAWLAGQQDLLAVFVRGEDVYTYAAYKIGSASRQLGKVMTLALGFGMGSFKFMETAAAAGIVLDEDKARALVDDWRKANPRIVAWWYALDEGFRRMVGMPNGTKERLGRLVLCKTGAAVRIRLPSGRELVYQFAAVEVNPDTQRQEIVYMGTHPTTKRWGLIRTYGGKLAENVTQAVARDVMAEALLALEAQGWPIIGSIHDEGLFETRAEQADRCLAAALAVFRAPPPWGAGLPVGAEGWVGVRYRKG